MNIQTLAQQMNTTPEALAKWIETLRPIVLRFMAEGATPEQALTTAIVKVSEFLEDLKEDEAFFRQTADEMWEAFQK